MMFDGDSESTSSFLEDDMIKVVDRLPTREEYRRVRHLILQNPLVVGDISDDELAETFAGCPHLETVVLSGVPNATDRSIVVLAGEAINLQGVNLSGCSDVTNVGVLELTTKSLPLQWIQLNGVVSLTDPSISAIAKTCLRLVELQLCDLPLLSPISVRDIWSFSRKLRTLRLTNNVLLTDRAFPSPVPDEPTEPNEEKPLPPRPTTWLERLPPLILRHTADNLRVLDLAGCNKITDEAIEGIVSHAPRIQSFILSGCNLLTDDALDSMCRLRGNLDVLMLAHVSRITDRGMVRLARACVNLRCIDVAFCRNLTDLSIAEIAELQFLQRLSLVRVHKLTDIGLYALAEHAAKLERLHLSYCDRISLEAFHLLLRKLEQLQHLTATGVPSLRRMGVHRFSEATPPTYDSDQQAAFSVFSGENIVRLRRFLDKEEARRREAEAANIPFAMRSDDKLDLY